MTRKPAQTVFVTTFGIASVLKSITLTLLGGSNQNDGFYPRASPTIMASASLNADSNVEGSEAGGQKDVGHGPRGYTATPDNRICRCVLAHDARLLPAEQRGTCYELGQYCRIVDHSTSGMANDGEESSRGQHGWLGAAITRSQTW
jgi:hypothetical protein